MLGKRTLLRQLSLIYGASVVLVLVIFTSALVLIASQLSNVLREHMSDVNQRIDTVIANTHRPHNPLIDDASNIAAQLREPGVTIRIFDPQHERAYMNDSVVTLDRRRHQLGNWIRRNLDSNFHPDYSTMQHAPAVFDAHPIIPNHLSLLSMILNVRPVEHPLRDGIIVLWPDVGSVGFPLLAFGLEFAGLVCSAIGLAFFIGRQVTMRALAPLHDVTMALVALSNGDFGAQKVKFSQRSEIGELARAYNMAVARIESAFAERDMVEQRMRQFIADAGHELRTPLTVILGYFDVLKREIPAETANQTKIFQTIAAEGQRMRSLVNNLILLMRLDQDTGRPHRTIDLTDLVQNIVEGMRPLDPEQRLQTAYHHEAQVIGDIDELREAITNLVDNALKYAPFGPIKIIVSQDHDAVRLDIQDQGSGIGTDEQELIFERFYRGSSSGSIEGSGLGLAIAHQAVQRAGGAIEVMSAPYQGTCFTLIFPLAQHVANQSTQQKDFDFTHTLVCE